MKNKITITRPADVFVYWGPGPLPKNAIAVGNVTRREFDTGILLRIGGTYWMGSAGVLRSLPQAAVIKALKERDNVMAKN